MRKDIFILIAAGLIILLFVYAGISKLLDFHRFVGELDNQPLPNSWTPLLSRAIPGIEIGVSILLSLERTRLAGFWLALIFMAIFTVYTLIVLLHGFSYIPCSCGGVIEKLSWEQHLFLNLFFALLSAAGIALERSRYSRSKART